MPKSAYLRILEDFASWPEEARDQWFLDLADFMIRQLGLPETNTGDAESSSTPSAEEP